MNETQAKYLSQLPCKFELSVMPKQSSVDVHAVIENDAISIEHIVLQPSGEELPIDSPIATISRTVIEALRP